MNPIILYALLAAALFGASTPFAKVLLGDISPVLLAGLLYLGSGIGLSVARLVRDRSWRPAGLARGEWPWLLGAIFFGGVLGPVALMMGLMHTSGAAASLLLNLEAVLTAVIAWVAINSSSWVGPALVSVACLCWAIDNNLTRKVSASDAFFIASSKGVIAGSVNCLLAFSLGATLPAVGLTLSTMLVGFLGYGISLVLFVLALRGLGTARTGAYFSTAPFIGALVAILVFGESPALAFWLASALMGLGVWLHLTESHAHHHVHEPMEHAHQHTHDEHHQHEHPPELQGRGAHSHAHQHAALSHKHPHFPDIHHRHPH
jgi:drug/metabolite transporter (DMT)-like permease